MSLPTEALPEFVHQGTGTHHLAAAIRNLRFAEGATKSSDKAAYLKRAEEHILFARRHAESVAGHWRTYNDRARLLGKFLGEDEPVTLD